MLPLPVVCCAVPEQGQAPGIPQAGTAGSQRCKAALVSKEWDELWSSPGWWWTASQQHLAGAKGHVPSGDCCGGSPSVTVQLCLGSTTCVSPVDGLLLQRRSHSGQSGGLADAYFPPVLILQQPSCRSFQGEEAGTRRNVWRKEAADVKTPFCVNAAVPVHSALPQQPQNQACPLPQGFVLLPSVPAWAVAFPSCSLGDRTTPLPRAVPGVNAVMFLRLLSLRVHAAAGSARTDSLFRSQMGQRVLGLHRARGNPLPLEGLNLCSHA